MYRDDGSRNGREEAGVIDAEKKGSGARVKYMGGEEKKKELRQKHGRVLLRERETITRPDAVPRGTLGRRKGAGIH